MGKSGKGAGKAKPETKVEPFVWPALYRQKPIVVEPKGAEHMSIDEYNSRRMDIPWPFRPQMKHPPFLDEVDVMREKVAAALEVYRQRLEEQRLAEEAAKAAAKSRSRPGSGRSRRGGKPNRPKSA